MSLSEAEKQNGKCRRKNWKPPAITESVSILKGSENKQKTDPSLSEAEKQIGYVGFRLTYIISLPIQ